MNEKKKKKIGTFLTHKDNRIDVIFARTISYVPDRNF